jgi:acetolactate synthase-1/2/3 large subunit
MRPHKWDDPLDGTADRNTIAKAVTTRLCAGPIATEDRVKVYRAFAQALAARGVSTLFGLMGDGNMYWVSAYAALPGTRWLPAWHEAGAVGMADGYAGASGNVGVATVTMGPGLAQSLAALTAAVRTRRQLLLITAEVTTNPPGQAQSAEQAAWVRACGAHYIRVDSAAGLGAALDDALGSAEASIPTVLSIVIDVFNAELDEPIGAPAPNRRAAPLGRSSESIDLDSAAVLLEHAVAPVVVVGHGVVRAGAIDAARALAAKVGAVFVTTVGAKGSLGHEQYQLGLTGMMAGPLARDLLSTADLVVVAGAALDLYNTDGGQLAPSARVIRIDHREIDQLWNPADEKAISLRGDVGELLEALTHRLSELHTGLRTADTLARIDAERARQLELARAVYADGPNPWAVLAALGDELPDDAHCVVGIGHFWYFVAPYLTARARSFQFGCGFALIGQALPLAIGAASSVNPRLVVAFEGDGSMAMNLQELQSAVRFGHNLLVVVLNNRGYGSEYHKLLLAGLEPRDGAFDAPIDLVAVAAAMGATALRADSIESLRSAMARLLATSGVRLLDVSIALSPMSEVYQRQHG